MSGEKKCLKSTLTLLSNERCTKVSGKVIMHGAHPSIRWWTWRIGRVTVNVAELLMACSLVPATMLSLLYDPPERAARSIRMAKLKWPTVSFYRTVGRLKQLDSKCVHLRC